CQRGRWGIACVGPVWKNRGPPDVGQIGPSASGEGCRGDGSRRQCPSNPAESPAGVWHWTAEKGIGNHSFCRNPDSSQKPWCYILYQDGVVQRQDCVIDTCRDETVGKITATPPSGDILTSPLGEGHVLEPAQALPEPDVSESEAVQPAAGPSWPGRVGLKRKKDLGILGYILGMVMMAVIVLVGLGITLGYFYKRARSLRRQQQQRAYEQEMRRVALPLSAFSNPTCELLDEMAPAHNAGPSQTPDEEPGVLGGADPLIAQAGTPGA
uniref:Phosphoinositide-3-kinase interacting protein 1 n=1 Tax=Scleropages formosus TaxID=113540 RepID=A0A8C9V5M0_SCLFO